MLGFLSPRDSIRPTGEFRTKEVFSGVGTAREDRKRDAVATVAAHVHKRIAAYQMSANWVRDCDNRGPSKSLTKSPCISLDYIGDQARESVWSMWVCQV